jgi:hypothetical protein
VRNRRQDVTRMEWIQLRLQQIAESKKKQPSYQVDEYNQWLNTICYGIAEAYITVHHKTKGK